MSEQLSKTCPGCGQVDLTDFSSCRYCGHKYNGASETETAWMTKMSAPKNWIPWIFGIVIISGSAFAICNSRVERADVLKPLSQSIAATGRARAMIFMTDWAAPGEVYATTVNAEAEKFGSNIDFYRLSMNDPTNKELMEKLGVQYSPTTAIFAGDGHESKTISGVLTQKDLDRYLENAVKQTEAAGIKVAPSPNNTQSSQAAPVPPQIK